ncbi:thiol:disulfide interchange protein DsbG [Paraburkholderia sediminicola]|uniref:thiol:disulfide interchange protein DsbG n=1 Tax=Paraburkholderia sediminicola TaxID=458836 RepID=UPI0038BA8419
MTMWAGSSFAAQSAAEAHLVASGARILQTFESSSGLKAVVAESGQDRRLFYVSPDGKSLIVGTVFDASGTNITSADMARAGLATDVPAPTALPGAIRELPAALWDRAGKLNWLEEGTGDNVMYVVFDPNCPYCRQLWSSLRPAVQSGKVRVRWLPVAILAESSKGLAAALYASKAPAQTMQQLVNHMLTPVKPSREATLSTSYNLLLLRDVGFTSVPTILFRRSGKSLAMTGEPDPGQLASLTGR